jgi:hypothetical protein
MADNKIVHRVSLEGPTRFPSALSSVNADIQQLAAWS